MISFIAIVRKTLLNTHANIQMDLFRLFVSDTQTIAIIQSPNVYLLYSSMLKSLLFIAHIPKHIIHTKITVSHMHSPNIRFSILVNERSHPTFPENNRRSTL